jgi:hypothetical protein
MAENEILAYKSINVFIEREYLEDLLGRILQAKGDLPKEEQIAFNNQFRKYITVLGFRNPLRAPRQLQINAYASAFEAKDEVVPFTLSTWTKQNQDVANHVLKWLDAQGWKDLSLERTFNDSDGFISDWPKNLSFEKITKKFKKDNPDMDVNDDDLILMVLWISGKLPPEHSEG